MIQNFHIQNSYHIDVKIISFSDINIQEKSYVYLDAHICKMLLESYKIDYTCLFESGYIRYIEIHENNFIVCRRVNADWSFVIAEFVLNIGEIFKRDNFEYSIVEICKILNRDQSQFNAKSNPIMLRVLNDVINNKLKEDGKYTEDAFEIININMILRNIQININNDYFNVNYLKKIISLNVERILNRYAIIYS